MRKIFLILLSSIFASASFAKNDTAATKIEQAVNTRNSLFKQEVFSVENIPAFRIDAIKITNLEKFEITNGLKVAYKHQSGKEIHSLYNFIDEDEIDGLITSLQYMSTLLRSKSIPSGYTEIKFISRSGFEVMLYTILNDSNKLDWAFVAQPDIKVDRSLVALQTDDIEKLKKTFSQAKSKL